MSSLRRVSKTTSCGSGSLARRASAHTTPVDEEAEERDLGIVKASSPPRMTSSSRTSEPCFPPGGGPLRDHWRWEMATATERWSWLEDQIKSVDYDPSKDWQVDPKRVLSTRKLKENLSEEEILEQQWKRVLELYSCEMVGKSPAAVTKSDKGRATKASAHSHSKSSRYMFSESTAQTIMSEICLFAMSGLEQALLLTSDRNYPHKSKREDGISETVPDIAFIRPTTELPRSNQSGIKETSNLESPIKSSQKSLHVNSPAVLAVIEVKASLDSTKMNSLEQAGIMQVIDKFARVLRYRGEAPGGLSYFGAVTDCFIIKFIKIILRRGMPELFISPPYELLPTSRRKKRLIHPDAPTQGFRLLRSFALYLSLTSSFEMKAAAEVKSANSDNSPVGGSLAPAFKERRLVLTRFNRERYPDGKYEVITKRELGHGSYCSVYAGYLAFFNDDASPSGAAICREGSHQDEVAIKIQKLSTSRQLRQESYFLDRLRGINGVPRKLFHGGTEFDDEEEDADRSGDWLHVLITEPVGVPLTRVVEKQKLNREEVLTMGEQLISIVRAIHERDILHRDICPRNIICLFDEDGQLSSVRLIDFGLASNKKDDKLYPIGYPSSNVFCSPCAHEEAPMGCSGDLESVVFVVYYLLAGELPWYRPHQRHQDPELDEVEDISLFKSAFYHLAVNGRVPLLAGTRCQEMMLEYYLTFYSRDTIKLLERVQPYVCQEVLEDCSIISPIGWPTTQERPTSVSPV